MSQGIKVWDAAGRVVVDISDRLPRFIGSYYFYIGAGAESTTISVPGAVPGEWYAFQPANSGNLCYVNWGSIFINRHFADPAAEDGYIDVFAM